MARIGMRAGDRFDWNEVNVAILRKRWAAGDTAAAIACGFGDSSLRSAVIGKVHRLGLAHDSAPKPRRPTEKGVAGHMVLRIRRKKRTQRQEGDSEPVTVAPMPKELPAEAIPKKQRKQLVDLDNDTCRFPFGTPGHADFFFCGLMEADFVSSRPYCRFHTKHAARG